MPNIKYSSPALMQTLHPPQITPENANLFTDEINRLLKEIAQVKSYISSEQHKKNKAEQWFKENGKSKPYPQGLAGYYATRHVATTEPERIKQEDKLYYADRNLKRHRKELKTLQNSLRGFIEGC